jgi:hypothetical protein
LNYRTNTLFTLDSPLSVKATDLPDSPPEYPRGIPDLQTSLDAYILKYYTGGGGSTSSAALDIDGESRVVQIVKNLENATSFWNARWLAEYTLKEGKICGSVKVVVHFYEGI